MNCAILAIGTELCLGQITNRNASWLAEHLHDLGYFTPWHRVVPDDRELIQEELHDLAQKAEIIVITGGLGPTTDDFTRDCVAHFLGRKLIWHEASWTWIQERLGERGIAVRDIQKQQCFYPDGAVVIENSVGTAHGFKVDLEQKMGKLRHVFVLPGPPLEVKSVFENGVQPSLSALNSQQDPLTVRSWDCLGRGESEVAHRVESVLANCPFTKAYRVHLPYVEFKLSFPKSRQTEAEIWCEKVEDCLGEWTALRDGHDAVADFLFAIENHIQPTQIWIHDSLSGAHLWERLATPLKTHRLAGKFNLVRGSAIRQGNGAPSNSTELYLGLKAISEDEVEVSYQHQGQRRRWTLQTPYRSRALSTRQKQYFVESAFLQWAREISSQATST